MLLRLLEHPSIVWIILAF